MATKTLSEQIVECQEAIAENKDKLIEATKALEADASDENEGAVVELTAKLEKGNARLETLKAAEKALGLSAAPATEGAGPAVISQKTKSKDADNLFGKLALCTYESRIKGMAMEHIAANRFKGEEALVEVIKAAQNPAMSGVAGYAAELVQVGYGQFIDALREAAILPKFVPLMQQHQFNGYGSIYVPTRLGGLTDAAAAWRAEGGAIPVKGLTFGHIDLTPKNMGVILTATEEMLARSSIDLAAYFQSAIISDTTEYLDTEFIGATAGSSIRPAGIQNGVAGGDTRPASGTGAVADIVTDIKVMYTALANAKMGSPSTRWIMSPHNWLAVSMAITATGALQFPETANGVLAGIPVVVTTKLADTTVLLVDFAQITSAFGTPAFLASNVATLHEESETPGPIATVGTPNAVAAPVRSLYQTNSWALRMMLDTDWAKLRSSGLVQQLTAVGWD